MRKNTFQGFIFIFLLISSISAALIDVGQHLSTYSGSTRGFWFIAPTDFTIVGLGLPTDASSASFDVSVLKFNDIPPQFSNKTHDFTTLFLSRNNAGSALLSTNIQISAGDIIGILGTRDSNAVNSYGQGNYETNILGFNVTISRLIMQAQIRSTDPITSGVSAEGSGSLGRILVDIVPTTPIPEPANLSLIIGGILLYFYKTIKRN